MVSTSRFTVGVAVWTLNIAHFVVLYVHGRVEEVSQEADCAHFVHVEREAGRGHEDFPHLFLDFLNVFSTVFLEFFTSDLIFSFEKSITFRAIFLITFDYFQKEKTLKLTKITNFFS